MTCIVGVAHKNGVIIGGDRITVSHRTVRLTNRPKVFKCGHALIGSSGGVRESNLIQEYITVDDIEPSIENIMQYVIIPIRSLLSVNGCLKTENSVEESGATFLVGVRNRLFSVYSDFQVDEYKNGYNSVGSGEDFALGSLYTSMVKDPRQRVKLALEAAEAHCSTVRAPFDIMEINYED